MKILARWMAAIAAMLVLAQPVLAQAGKASAAKSARALPIEKITADVFTGDFQQMMERRHIRIVVPYSRTLYFNDKGQERGLTADVMREFERHLNKKYAKQLGRRPLTIVLIPSTRDDLFDAVRRGTADIAAGNLTITEQRLKKVDFVAVPGTVGESELIVTGPKSPAVATLDDLAGKTIHVRPASSYYQSIADLNARFAKERKTPMKVVDLPDALEDEDILEMLNVGLIDLAVVDDWKGRMWAQILPAIKVREHLAVRKGVKVGWAIRQGSPQLKAEAEQFLAAASKSASAEYRLKQAMSRVKRIRNNTADAEIKRFEQTLAVFEKYGKQYGFDPLMLAALGYQESQLRQDAKSPVGAIGIMQVMPATGTELKVGDVKIAENNIHAGAKYMDQLMGVYFKEANFTDADRALFAFASYNAGPGRISQMRKEAAKRGLNPDRWFHNVEIVTAEKVGIETTTYVRNIFKYYTAYRLALDTQLEQKRARQSITPKQ
jgi:membrane-bound lytic murein transglycosylase MltF